MWENPLRELLTLQERMNRLLDDTVARPTGMDEHAMISPPVDIYEMDGEIVLKMELPEVDRDDVTVDFDQNRLRIVGERKRPADVPRERYLRVERAFGRFARSFDLPPTIEVEAIKAEHKNGVLTIRMPKRNEPRAKHVVIVID